MSQPDLQLISHCIQTITGIIPISFASVWEDSDWSKTLKVTSRQNEVYFLKGILRTSNEAQVTKILYEQNNTVIPEIIIDDILPELDWQWFLMRDAGVTDYDNLSLATAKQTAYQLGKLQRQVVQNKELNQLLPQCPPNQYLEIIESIGEWMQSQFPSVPPRNLEITRSILPTRKKFFDKIASVLAPIPMTCVHVDLWSGNIAVSNGQVRLLDWSNSVWGVGAASIINMLTVSDEIENTAEIWDMYEQGFQVDMTDEIVSTSEVAYLINSLVVEKQLAELFSKSSKLPVGIPPILEQLVTLSDKEYS